eukprot:2964359-Amphidinium_carterae.2
MHILPDGVASVDGHGIEGQIEPKEGTITQCLALPVACLGASSCHLPMYIHPVEIGTCALALGTAKET